MREEQGTQKYAISEEQKTKVSEKWTERQRGSEGEWEENLPHPAGFLS